MVATLSAAPLSVVRYGGRLVASTLLELAQTPSSLESDLTVTLPAHRSKGVATMLKAHALAWVQGAGEYRRRAA